MLKCCLERRKVDIHVTRKDGDPYNMWMLVKNEKATPKLREDKVKQCVDTILNGEYPPKAVAMMAAVAALCVQYEADFRPNTSIVIKALQPLLNTRSGPPGESHHW